MNSDIVKGRWKQFQGHMRAQWGRLTDNQLSVIDGRREQLAGRIQEAYGLTQEQAEKEIADFERRHAD